MKNAINANRLQQLAGANQYEFELNGAQYVDLNLKSQKNIILIGSDLDGIEHILGQGTEIKLRTRLQNFTHLVVRTQDETPVTAQLHLVEAGQDKQDYTPAKIHAPRVVEDLETQIRRGIEKVLKSAGVYSEAIDDADDFEDGDMQFDDEGDFLDMDTPYMETENPIERQLPPDLQTQHSNIQESESKHHTGLKSGEQSARRPPLAVCLRR